MQPKKQMEKKIKQLTKKNQGLAIDMIRKGIDFNLRLSDKEIIMFVGGILSKLIDGEQYIFIRERGWVGI